jgi:hypothetical protein
LLRGKLSHVFRYLHAASVFAKATTGQESEGHTSSILLRKSYSEGFREQAARQENAREIGSLLLGVNL